MSFVNPLVSEYIPQPGLQIDADLVALSTNVIETIRLIRER